MANRIGILLRDTISEEFESFSSSEYLEQIGLKVLAEAEIEDQEVSLLLTDNNEMKELNQHFRGIDEPTDVLAFAVNDGEEIPSFEALLGDIVISIPYMKKQALELGVSLQEELLRLFIHGVLHLIGYDHEVSEEEAEKMAREEERILDAVRHSFQQ
jgi:probable rRNA maturation factor